MTEKNKKCSKTVLKSVGQNFKKSRIAFKVGFVANSLAVLTFVLCLLHIFPLYAVIIFGVCVLVSFIAHEALLIDTLIHRGKKSKTSSN
ncbi:MAG: hypothetical protein K0S76_2083 [Herbinix sp.]|nr:hypothetical protein [Herbinix sp.]